LNFSKFKKWLLNRLNVDTRSRKVLFWYILSLMLETRKHSLTAAARLSGLDKSQFSRFLKNHFDQSVYTLDTLSKNQARQFSMALTYLGGNKLPWKIAILIDSTIQHRSTRKTDNGKKFNHGNGFVIGHQWTNIVLIVNEMLIPLPPIPFHSKKYSRKNKLKYRSEHELVIEYIENVDLKEYFGAYYNPKEVVVIADSGYDNKKIECAVIDKKWTFIVALGKTRCIKSEKMYLATLKSKDWFQIAEFFRTHRMLKWQTIRIVTNSAKRKRMDFRIRQIIGYLRGVGKVKLICSEFKKRPDGRRKYLACNDLKATARQILIGYKIRWSIEIFHKNVKMHLGFEDIAVSDFIAVKSHVHWVYCAFILLNSHPPGIPDHVHSVLEKQRYVKKIIDTRETSRIHQKLTQIDGLKNYKAELKRALETL